MRRHSLGHEFENRFRLHRLLQHDDSLRHFTRFFIGVGNYCRIGDARMTQQYRFEFRRRDLKAFVLNNSFARSTM